MINIQTQRAYIIVSDYMQGQIALVTSVEPGTRFGKPNAVIHYHRFAYIRSKWTFLGEESQWLYSLGQPFLGTMVPQEFMHELQDVTS